MGVNLGRGPITEKYCIYFFSAGSPHSPYIQQLERLSLTSNYGHIVHASSPIGFDLWQRHSNGILHIDSDDTIDTFPNQSSSPSDENTFSGSGSHAGPPVASTQFCHPSSNYAYKKERSRKPVWQYPTDIPLK